MKIKLLLVVLSCFVIEGFSQDSIVNFLDYKGNIVSKRKGKEFEILVKKDTLWQMTKYYRNGKVKERGHFKTKEKQTPIGEFVIFNRNGKVVLRRLYDKSGKKHGKSISWFDNDSINAVGVYMNDKKEGLWKYYHYNGGEASRMYYKNDSILKTVFHDETGNLVMGQPLKDRIPFFIGGQKKFKSEVNGLLNAIDYKVTGKLVLNISFDIDVNGRISNVEINEKIPERFYKQIVLFIEDIEGWQYGIHNNRRYPASYRFPITFNPN